MIAGIRYFIGKARNWAERVSTINALHIHEVQYGNNLRINGKVLIFGSNITIGSDVILNSGMRFNPIGGQDTTTLCTYTKGRIAIGNHVSLSNSSICAFEEVVIEDYVMIGGGCRIYDTDFHSVVFEKRIAYEDTDIRTHPVHIKRGAFIGAHAMILKGVTVGERAVIGAGSVVTQTVPAGEIWAGNPARFIKKLPVIVND